MALNLVAFEQLTKTYGEKTLLGGVSGGIEEGDRIGLIGVNGTGKSTLLKMIAGSDKAESGVFTKGKDVVVQYLPQDPVFTAAQTVLDHVFESDLPVFRAVRAYEALLLRAEAASLSAREQSQLIRLQGELDALDGWQLESEGKAILTRLGITDFEAPVDTLSGGQRKRVAMARALIQPADVLLLDEPTNHIDHQTVAWLEGYLQKRKGALLMVTHDRYFLERVVNRIWELHRGRLYSYAGNYEDFLAARIAREEQESASEDKRQNFLRNEIAWIRRGPRARGTKQKARTDRYYEVLEQEPTATDGTIDWTAPASRLGNTVLELHGVCKVYGERVLVKDFTYLVTRRDRIGIVGANGMGKSTLLRMMAGRVEPDQGTVVVGETVRLGYFAQEHEDLDGSKRVIEYVRDVAQYVETADGETITAAQMLERFLFPSNVQWTPVNQLSGGEKRRLALLRVLMGAPNVLLLDELTNDLDVQTLSVLESYLDQFPGAVVAVSHDRYFLDRVVDQVFAMEGDGRIGRYLGDYSTYLQKAADTQTVTKPVEETRSPAPTAQKPVSKKLTLQEQKEFATIEDEIAVLEMALEDITQQLNATGNDYARVQELFAKQETTRGDLDRRIERWAYLTERAEESARS